MQSPVFEKAKVKHFNEKTLIFENAGDIRAVQASSEKKTYSTVSRIIFKNADGN